MKVTLVILAFLQAITLAAVMMQQNIIEMVGAEVLRHKPIVDGLATKDELSSNFIDKDGNLRGSDGNFITELPGGGTASTTMWISPESVTAMRSEAKEARK